MTRPPRMTDAERRTHEQDCDRIVELLMSGEVVGLFKKGCGCSVPDCHGSHYSLGLCKRHYTRIKDGRRAGRHVTRWGWAK